MWSVDIPKYQIALLVVAFFVGVWAALLLVLTHFSKTHTWLLPVFAVGLGAPRWCQVSVDHSPCVLLLILCLDALGYIVSGIIHPMGWQCRTVSRHIPLAVVRCTRRRSRCRSGNDPASGNNYFFGAWKAILMPRTDPFPPSRLRHARLCANHWIRLCHDRPCHSSQSARPFHGLPRCCQMGFLRWSERWVSNSLVLE